MRKAAAEPLEAPSLIRRLEEVPGQEDAALFSGVDVVRIAGLIAQRHELKEMVREKEARGAWDDPNEKKTILIGDAVATFLQSVMARSNGKAKSTTHKIDTDTFVRVFIALPISRDR